MDWVTIAISSQYSFPLLILIAELSAAHSRVLLANAWRRQCMETKCNVRWRALASVLSVFQSSTSCDYCKHFMDGPYCVSECPERKYPDSNNTCQPCHEYCEGNCTGGGNSVGPGACNSCAIVVLDSRDNITSCLPVESKCEDSYFKTPLQGQQNGKHVSI